MPAQNFAKRTMNLLIIAHSPLGAAYAELLRHIFPENTLPPVHVLDIAPHEGHAAIIARRDSIGGYTSVEQLKDVKGIGPAKYAELEKQVTL